ncbi:hydrogenase maturation protease [Amycolatopsis cihanbeyliensis]|uniref:Hydrogenase maturation protease n=1 Tax=Amycolatopsis cihanbeyliensis TaxID=1128664 RepID=A0A542DFL3_AMYCI|nr:hydrogenase maturation protease [Amycolatopsis cihanbeyliensis]TQJ01873.1 hydrogenase maturation protease [Amycolatopsis cihanbeyliensis]
MKPCVLVAGVGNSLLGDDGFGMEVIQHLESACLPGWVQIADYEIGGRITCDLVGGYDTTILIDATPRGEQPGTVSVLEIDPGSGTAAPSFVAGHGMRPDAVFQLLELLGCDAGRVLLVSCEPLRLGSGIGLSPPVHRAVRVAVRAVTDLAWGASPGLEQVET